MELYKEKGRILKTSEAKLEHTDYEKEVAQSNGKRMHQSTQHKLLRPNNMMRPNMQRHRCHYPNNGDTWGVEVPINPRTKIIFGNKKKNVKIQNYIWK
jgi:hypothetical protein